MGLKSQVMRNAAAARQAASTPSGCKACQRTGLPLFPLRIAAVPKTLLNASWKPWVPKQDVELAGGEFKYALRTLRMGYVYVLLDKTDWQGYEVTAEGYLRQFNPLVMPEGETVEPLSQSCLQHGHEISASFINIDDNQYSEAWLAFSHDPWSREVLDNYKQEAALDALALKKSTDRRFTKILLAALKTNPRDIPEALIIDPGLSSMKANVAEFATNVFTNTEKVTGDPHGGAHGFYPQMDSAKQMALRLRVAQLSTQYGCPIVALALNDSVGVVQELNNSRMQITEAKQEYIEQPGVFHKHIISKAITTYLDNFKKQAERDALPRVELHPSQYILAGPNTNPKIIPKEQVAKEIFAEQFERLTKSYDEPARAAFAREFERRFTWANERLNAIDTDLAAWYQAPDWLTILSHDYSPDSLAASWAAQMRMLAACLQGGAMGKATEKVWEKWLKEPDSPAYKGFAGMNSTLLDAIFNYGHFKAIWGSDDFSNYLKDVATRRSWASRMLAVTGSVSRLGNKVSEATRKSYLRMIQGALLAAGESTVVLEYKTTFRNLKKYLETHAALRKALTEKNAVSGGRAGTVAVVDEIIKMRGKALDAPIIVQYSTQGTLEALQKELPNVKLSGTPFNNPAMIEEIHDLFISDLSLAEKGTTKPVMRASYAQMAQFNEQAQRFISGESAGLILGAGLMAMQLYNWHDLTARLSKTIGYDVDATTDVVTSNLLLIEGISEFMGFAFKLTIKQNWIVAKAAPDLVRLGGVLGGMANIVDGIRDSIHGAEAGKEQDGWASTLLYIASVLKIISGRNLIVHSVRGTFALTVLGLAPESTALTILGITAVGWALILFIVAVIVASWAHSLRSNAFEIWLRRTCFGIPGTYINNYPVWHAESMADLQDAMANYQAIVKGMVADAAFSGTTSIQTVAYSRVEFRVLLPCWDAEKGGWSVSVTSGSDNKILFSESHGAPGIDDHYKAVRASDYYHDTSQQYSEEIKDNKGKKTGIMYLDIMGSVWIEQRHHPTVTLVATYWPDKTQPNNKMALTITAEQSWFSSDTHKDA